VSAEYLTIKQVASVLKTSYSYIYSAITSGDLPALNLGSHEHGCYRVLRSDLDEWVRSKRTVFGCYAERSERGKKWFK